MAVWIQRMSRFRMESVCDTSRKSQRNLLLEHKGELYGIVKMFYDYRNIILTVIKIPGQLNNPKRNRNLTQRIGLETNQLLQCKRNPVPYNSRQKCRTVIRSYLTTISWLIIVPESLWTWRRRCHWAQMTMITPSYAQPFCPPINS